MKDGSLGILIILGIIFVTFFGGAKNFNTGSTKTTNDNPAQREPSTEEKIITTQKKIEDLKLQIQIEEDAKTRSQYRDIVTLSSISRSEDPKKEYATIKVAKTATGTITVTGWTLKSINSGNQVTIPKGTYLFFTGMLNAEENIVLTAGDTLYLITGISPNGASFKTNICSGYLGQFQTFVPYLSNNCPYPGDEDLSSIPKLVINDECLDYIDRMGRCKIQTKTPPLNWSHECVSFIYDKINYPSCVNTHKNDKNFYLNEWRVYLKRTERIWKSQKETIILYDNVGKIVDTIRY